MNNSIKSNLLQVKDSFGQFVKNGGIPILVYNYYDENGDIAHLQVNLSVNTLGVHFELDTLFPVNPYFDGVIIDLGGGCFVYPIDEYENSLDIYLQAIDNNILEGIIIPNKLDIIY